MRGRVIRNHFSNQRPQGDDNSGYGSQEIQLKSLGKMYIRNVLFLNSKIYVKVLKSTPLLINRCQMDTTYLYLSMFR